MDRLARLGYWTSFKECHEIGIVKDCEDNQDHDKFTFIGPNVFKHFTILIPFIIPRISTFSGRT